MENIIPPDKTFHLLRDKLKTLEIETQNLAEKLDNDDLTDVSHSDTSHSNQNTPKSTPKANDQSELDKSDISATETKLFVSRVCRNESQLQSLQDRITVMSKSRPDCDNIHRDCDSKVSQVKRDFADTISDLKIGIEQARGDARENGDAKKILSREVVQLKQIVDQFQAKEAVSQGLIKELTLTKTKLEKRSATLQDEITEELSLRSALEESQATLYQQIRAMEVAMGMGRQEAQSLTSACASIGEEASANLQQLNSERDLRITAEQNYTHLNLIVAEKTSEVTKGEEKLELVEEEMRALTVQYATLIEQLKEMERITTHHGDMNAGLRAQNKKLKEALIQAAVEKDELKQAYLKNEEELKEKSNDKGQLDEVIRQLEDTQKELQVIKDESDMSRRQKDTQIEQLQRDVDTKQKNNDVQLKDSGEESEKLKKRLKHSGEDNERLLLKKQALISEHKKNLADLCDEKIVVESGKRLVELELSTVMESKARLENEVTTLTQQIGALEQQKVTHRDVEGVMRDMMKVKNGLAYDKGQLQQRVEQMEQERLSHGAKERETASLAAMLEGKYKKSQTECDKSNMEVKRLEGSMQQLKAALGSKSDHVIVLQRCYDDTAAENLLLRDQMETMESHERDREQQSTSSLSVACADKQRIERTLEAMMSSHSQLQLAVETLEVDLGNRDRVIDQLKHDISELTRANWSNRDSQQDSLSLGTRMNEMEQQDSDDVNPICKTLAVCRRDNEKMASTLEELLDCNTSLQTAVIKLRAEVTKKNKVIHKLKVTRITLGEEMKAELNGYDVRMAALQNDLEAERLKGDKKTSRECSELRRQCDSLSFKNGELSRSNLDLRNRLGDLVANLKESKGRRSDLKSQLDRVTNSKKRPEDNASLMETLKLSVENMEKAKDQYMKINEVQAVAIERLTEQISRLQSDICALCERPTLSESLGCEKGREGECDQQEQLTKHHQERGNEEEEVQSKRLSTEERLREVSEESLEISRHLEEAKSWFKERFSSFVDDLTKSQQNQYKLEVQNQDKQLRLDDAISQAHVTATRAKQIIQVSRMTMEQLTKTDTRAKNGISRLARELSREKDHSRYVEMMNARIKESSGRQMETLVRELSQPQTQTHPFNKSQQH